MLNIPYEKNRGNTCALSCYTMTARYFFPEVTFEQIARISDWQKGYVIWGFKFWLWIMNKGIKITDYDLINLAKWAEDGIDSLNNELSKEELDFIKKNTYKIDSYSDDIRNVLAHPNFTFKQIRPTWNDLEYALKEDSVCEIVLDSVVLDGRNGPISLHRVEILGIVGDYIFFS